MLRLVPLLVIGLLPAPLPSPLKLMLILVTDRPRLFWLSLLSLSRSRSRNVFCFELCKSVLRFRLEAAPGYGWPTAAPIL